MSWLLPTLIAATLGGTSPQAPILPMPSVVVAQLDVPSKGGDAPAATGNGQGAAAQGEAGAEGAAQGQRPQEGPGMGSTLVVMGLIFLFFWLFFIRPQNKQMKEHQKLVAALKKGDDVVTQGGMFGRITGFDDAAGAVFLEIAKDVRVKIVRSQIARVQGAEKPAAEGELKSKTPK